MRPVSQVPALIFLPPASVRRGEGSGYPERLLRAVQPTVPNLPGIAPSVFRASARQRFQATLPVHREQFGKGRLACPPRPSVFIRGSRPEQLPIIFRKLQIEFAFHRAIAYRGYA